MNKLIVGLVFLALALWGASAWWWFLWDVIKGVFVVALFGSGLLLVGLGIKTLTSSQVEPAKD